MLTSIHKHADIYYIAMCVVLLIAQLGLIAAAIKFKKDRLLICGLALTVLSIWCANHFPFDIDIPAALIGIFAVIIYGTVCLFTLIARAFWLEERPRTGIWKAIFFGVIAAGTIGIFMSIVNRIC